jgi:hypothetical protein
MRQLGIALVLSIFLTPLATSLKARTNVPAAPLTAPAGKAKTSRNAKPHRPGRIRPRVKGKQKRGASANSSAHPRKQA